MASIVLARDALGANLDGTLTVLSLCPRAPTTDDEGVAETVAVLVGVLCLLLGAGLLLTALFRVLGESWPLGAAERWLLPLTGVGLVAAGRWLIA